MSIVAATIGLLGAGVSTGLSIKKMKDAKEMRERAEREIRDFEYQDLNTLRVSTAMEDIMQEESARNFATATESLREGGTRAQAGALPKLAAAYSERDKKIYAGLDAKQKELDKQKVTLQEERDKAAIGGYGSLMNIGMQNQYQGMADLTSSIGNLGEQVGSLTEEEGWDDFKSNISGWASNIFSKK